MEHIKGKSSEELKVMQSILARQLRLLGSDMIDGTLSHYKVRCGRSSCRCMTDPQHKHEKYNLTKRVAGKTVNTYVPVDQIEQVRQWCANYRIAKGLLKELGAINHEMLAAISRESRAQRKAASMLKKVD